MREVTIITNAELVKIIKRQMEQDQMTIAATARKIGVNYQYFYEMVIGRWPVTPEVARHFGYDRLDYVFTPRPARKARAKAAGAGSKG